MTRHRNGANNKRDSQAHAAILRAARELLAERGPGSFAIEAVAKRAGVGKTTIYRWWPDKADLILEILNRDILPVPEIPAEASLETEMRIRMTSLLRDWQETSVGKIFRNLIIEMQASPAHVERLRSEALRNRRAQSALMFERAMARGEIPRNANIEALLDMLYGWAWYRLLTGQLVPDAAFHQAIRYIAWSAKMAPPSDDVWTNRTTHPRDRVIPSGAAATPGSAT